MAMCSYCGSTIIFGGVKEGSLRFCNDKCHGKGYVLRLAEQIPQNVLDEQAALIHQGTCPQCEGPGPVDVHTSHRVWSALIFTSWSSNPQVCCRSCGIKSQLGDTALSFFVGWWGLPWGVIMTPVQLVKNIAGMLSPPNPSAPSQQLLNIVKIWLATKLIAAQQSEET